MPYSCRASLDQQGPRSEDNTSLQLPRCWEPESGVLCGISLTSRTHDSMNARKAHNTGRNHVSNVRDYFASLGHDKAQNIIDAIIQSHEGGGGRQQMMAAPSMRLGAGFMNPVVPSTPNLRPACPHSLQPGLPPFPPQGGFPQGGPPPFAPPFPPNMQGPPPPGMPPFPPQGMNSMPPFASQRPPPHMAGMPPPTLGGPGMPPNGSSPLPPPTFTPAQGPPGGGAAPGIHPDRMRMMGSG